MANRLHTNIVVIVGGRGTGKTTKVQKIIASTPLPKKLVIDTFHHPMYKDWPQMPIDFFESHRWNSGRYHLSSSNPDKILQMVADHVRNTLVVFEDASKLIYENPQNDVRRIILDSKQTGNDVILIYHSLAEVPKKLFRWMDFLVLFKTAEVIEDQKSRISCYTRILPHFKTVNNHPSKYYNQTIAIAAD